jgi:hypothetical protein
VCNEPDRDSLRLARNYARDVPAEGEGGREALLDHLLRFDLSAVNLRQIPTTAALLDQKVASLPPEKGWLLDLLRNGRLPWGLGCSDNECPCDALFDSYVNHANRQGARRRSIETAIGGLLKRRS